MPKIKQIQDGCKGRVDILKSIKEKSTLLEDWKSFIFFKVSDVVNELEGPPIIKGSTLISPNELDIELFKLKDNWAKEFDDLLYFSKYSMRMWTIDYVNLNKNASIDFSEAHENLIQVEREFFEMNIK